MNLQYIKNNYRTFRQAEFKDWWTGPLRDCLQALFFHILQQDWDDDAILTAAKDLPLKIFTGFDVYLGYRSQAELHAVEYNGVLVGVVYNNERGYHASVTSASSYGALAKDLARRLLELKLTEVTAVAEDDDAHLTESVLVYVDASYSAFYIPDPRQAFGSQALWKNHRAFYPQDDGQLTLVDRFVAFSRQVLQIHTDPSANLVLVEIGGVAVEVDGRRLVFEVRPGEIDQPAVKEAFLSDREWMLDLVYEDRPFAHIRTTVERAWHSETITVEFASAEERDRFQQAYPQCEWQLGRPFVFEELGFKGRVITPAFQR